MRESRIAATTNGNYILYITTLIKSANYIKLRSKCRPINIIKHNSTIYSKATQNFLCDEESQTTLSQRIRRWIPKYLSTYHTKSAICCLLYDSLQIDTTIFTTLLRLPLLDPTPPHTYLFISLSHTKFFPTHSSRCDLAQLFQISSTTPTHPNTLCVSAPPAQVPSNKNRRKKVHPPDP